MTIYTPGNDQYSGYIQRHVDALTNRAYILRRRAMCDCPDVRDGLDDIAGRLEQIAAELLALDREDTAFCEAREAARLPSLVDGRVAA